MDINWSYKNKSRVFDTKENGGVPISHLRRWMIPGWPSMVFHPHGRSQQGKFSTMNFSYSRGDAAEDVLENFTRMAAALGVERDRMVVSHQTHTVNLRRVTLEDAGKGVIKGTGLQGHRRADYRCAGAYPGDLLCGLCAPVPVGSGKQGHWAQPFRMEGNG